MAGKVSIDNQGETPDNWRQRFQHSHRCFADKFGWFMVDKNQYMHLWDCCEYFLAHAASGVNLASFDLIKKTYQGQSTADAYVYERLTRPVLAKSAKGIKRLIGDYVKRDRLGQLERTATSLEESLKANLMEDLLRHFEGAMVRYFLDAVTNDTAPEALLTLAAAYHTYYKNKDKTGMGLPPWFFSIFYALLVKSQKGDMHIISNWQKILKKSLSAHWQGKGHTGEKLTAFLEHEVTCKVMSQTLTGILGFIQEENDKVFYLFDVTHQLSDGEYKYFQTLAVNGLNAIRQKQKRFAVQTEGSQSQVKIGVISKDQIQEIVNRVVDRYFDPALDWCVQYQLSVTAEQPRRKLASQFDKTFLAMNKALWKELLTLADIRRRVIFRTRHLLRILIHYLFEARGTDREFWQKYIASVDAIVQSAFKEEKDRLRQFNTLLGKRLSVYRNAEKYQGTDWEGFYKDPQSRDIAIGVIREITLKAGSDNDPNLPAFWFSSQVEKGVDDRVLYRLFRQGLETA